MIQYCFGYKWDKRSIVLKYVKGTERRRGKHDNYHSTAYINILFGNGDTWNTNYFVITQPSANFIPSI